MKQIISLTLTEHFCAMTRQIPILWEASQTRHKQIHEYIKMIKKKFYFQGAHSLVKK